MFFIFTIKPYILFWALTKCFFLDRKSKLDSYKGEKGPIEKYSVPNTIQLDSDDEEEELDYILSDDNEDLDGFVVDDDMTDGEKNSGTAKDSEMANSIMMEMPGI